MGKITKSLFFGSLLLVSVIACASFSYRWYILDFENGKLRGPKNKDDLPLNFCARNSDPGPDNGYKCVVLDIEEFRDLRKDYDDKVERLKACEKK